MLTTFISKIFVWEVTVPIYLLLSFCYQVHADHLGGTTQEGPTFKRKLSKREKKELKKKEKEAKSKGKENEKPAVSVTT